MVSVTGPEAAAPLLQGRTAIVTGAAGLIGSETARVLAAAGARVVLADVAGSTVDQEAKALRVEGHDVDSFVFDLTDESSVKALVEFTVRRFGGIDVIDNNAGATKLSVAQDQDLIGMTTPSWDKIYAINVRGPMLLIKHALPIMFERGGGSIVNISSAAADQGDLAFAAYGSSKAALNTLTKYVATAYGERGIRCNAVSPGPIRSASPDAPPKSSLALEQLLIGNTLVPRLGVPRDIAEAVLFLAGPQSAFITGQIIAVDGGFMSHWPTFAALREMKRAAAGGLQTATPQQRQD
jgi:NAD(P)-dependent dehydrogenase (short-subunit alcohol dehydrogenase family)